ncbi:uncharacterized protein PADG_06758 [Paracoccidioides brasiliensis Pb18]|uniref:Tat pathway signal sequence n=1 Tax=Paracoccidioides brasiliensis (strain Pb18) TaxID=502780 RepID=C1GHM2_PARBD|nr:uncharacterized protein PADG_06758 [Paracoccidioides brasiliensis Pb18]EEH50679.1 hypothetical protein PADG_06758 [Paracoccidioides brasiliensis Pb18]
MFRNWPGSSEFRRIHQNLEDTDAEAEEQLLAKGKHFSKRPTTKAKYLFSAISGFFLGIFGTVSYFLLINPSGILLEKNAFLKQTSYWSKVLDEIEISTNVVMMNGTLFPPPDPTFARGEPSVENDGVWQIFENIRTHVITRDQIIKLGKDPDTVSRFDDEYWGFGQNAYMAQLDIFHQIHCLNRLRKAAFATYPGYEPADMENPYSKMWWIHISHCVDMLLQNIKCHGNTDMITLDWVGNRGKLWPDFSIKHKCRDFDAILNWNVENSVDGEKFNHMPLPKDAYIWPEPWNSPEFELGHPLSKNTWKEGRQCR